jgi:HEAT repeat protein
MGLAEFQYLVANMTAALVAPDPHFDCIHMLSEVHWTKLRDEVATHPPDWREALAYVLSQGPTHEALPLLSELLRDTHVSVAQQAALSLVDLTDLEPALVVPEGDLHVMRQIAAHASENLDDLRAFLSRTTT